MLTGKHILLGITGSIAAYKSVFLTRLLIKAGAEVQVLMTPSAMDFVGPLTLHTLSRRPVLSEISSEEGWNNHVELGLWADAMVIAPATANTLAKLAHGHCDNIVSASYLSARCQVMIAPAMDVDMWHHPATQRNIKQLVTDGVQLLPVEEGELASGLVGAGRMAEPETIMAAITRALKKKSELAGLRAIVTAGPTYEDLDPVRFIGNRSSGKMGVAIAEELAGRGATVDLVIGPSHVEPNTQLIHAVHRVRSAGEMYEQCVDLWSSADLAVLAAAVADYRPEKVAGEKIKKKDGPLAIALERTQDIAATLGSTKRSDQITIGFALESDEGEASAQRKLIKKRFDFIVLNSLATKGAGFQHDTNQVTFYFPDREKRAFDLKPKTEVAADIVDEIVNVAQTKKERT